MARATGAGVGNRRPRKDESPARANACGTTDRAVLPGWRHRSPSASLWCLLDGSRDMCGPLRIACQRGRVVPAGTYPPIPASATPTERGCGEVDATAASARVPSTDDHRVRMGVLRRTQITLTCGPGRHRAR